MSEENSQESLVDQDILEEVSGKLKKLENALNEVLMGKSEIIEKVLLAMICQGHLLLEGLPGLGKTELVKGLSQLVSLQFKRIQFTPDLMPGDITGTMILEENKDGQREMKFKPGPLFSNLVLADEINRASPKTQSALLEAMAERQISVMGTSYLLEEPFLVFATQNPIELEGTYPLPEAQLDRFLFKLIITNVDEKVMTDIIMQRTGNVASNLSPILEKDFINQCIQLVRKIYLPVKVAEYIARIVAGTNPASEKAMPNIKNYLRYGCSPRAGIYISLAAKALALLNGKPNVGFDEVNKISPSVLHHRMILNYQGNLDKVDPYQLSQELVENTLEIDQSVLSGRI
ncbi:MAG: AAA family ATPase [Planctomycetota bacterium]|nr:MAG: AAA family ATPase [Planctomycetota bacterium]